MRGETLILKPLAIIIGVWGGFPKPPAIFYQLGQNELFQYLLVFILAYSGGSDNDLAIALMVTLGLYLLTKILDLRTLVSSLEYRQQNLLMEYLDQVPVQLQLH